MQRLAPLCALLVTAAALSAAAATKADHSKPRGDLSPPSAAVAGLRGPAAAPRRSISPTVRTPASAFASALAPTPSLAFRPATAGASAAVCRQGCAASRYTCLADPDVSDCDATWSQCAAGCLRP